MGGKNSTRWDGYMRKTTVEECIAVSVPSLREVKAALIYDLMEDEQCSESMNEIVTVAGKSEWTIFSFTITLQRLGGYRFWFLCPGCTKRVFKLYLPPEEKEYQCRKCHDLTYMSSQVSK